MPGLPLERDYDATDAGPLPAPTVNNVQDAIVGRKHGPVWLALPEPTPCVIGGSLPPTLGSAAQWTHTGGGGDEFLLLRLPYAVGTRIRAVRAYLDGSSLADPGGASFDLWEQDPSTGLLTTQLGVTKTQASSYGVQELTEADGGAVPLPYAMLEGMTYRMIITLGAGTGIGARYSHGEALIELP